jgi:hypothetical protein
MSQAATPLFLAAFVSLAGLLLIRRLVPGSHVVLTCIMRLGIAALLAALPSLPPAVASLPPSTSSLWLPSLALFVLSNIEVHRVT